MSAAAAIPRRPRAIPPAAVAQLLVTIKNFWALRRVYGAAFVLSLPAALHARACAAGITKHPYRRAGENRFLLAPLPGWAQREEAASSLSELALATLCGTPVAYGPWSVLVELAVELAGDGAGSRPAGDARPEESRLDGVRPSQDDGWRDAYAAAMDAAARLYAQFAAGKLAFAFQPIVALREPERELYQEALLRVQGPEREARSAGSAIATLERLRLIRHIDYCAVKAILALLEARPTLRLGCNISAESAVEDAWWGTVFAQLRGNPDLAGRLVIEITESARIPDSAAALAFVRRLQASGCKVAIDDFGSGFTPLDFVVRARPDIIKIGREYLRQGRECETAREVFHHLAGLGASVAEHVVVEGVETDGDLQWIGDGPIGRRRNVWAQGWSTGRPTLSPAWHACAPCVLAASRPNLVPPASRRAQRNG